MDNDIKKPSTTTNEALLSAMDILARREHSETELVAKLKALSYSTEDIDLVLQKAKLNRWLSSAESQSEALAQKLHQKLKGFDFICATLEEKGLPSIRRDDQLELEKALSLVKNKYSSIENLTREEKLKAIRFLASRGFDSSTIEKVFHDEEF